MSTEPSSLATRTGPISLRPALAREFVGRLPVPVSTLVGRERDVAALAALLTDPAVRLATLTGPGGVGKTRLALAAAAAVARDFADGAVFVDLASVRDAELVVPAIAQALGVRPRGDQPAAAAVEDVLRDRIVLLVLDNFEQVVAAGPRITDLLKACASLKALVTSRALLHVSGERAVPVAPLSLPETGRREDGKTGRETVVLPVFPSSRLPALESAAVRLFVERTREVRPDFVLTPSNALEVAEICQRLDGLPLAIELAAVRGRLFPPAVLLARLEPRLPQLSGGPRDLPARLQTMRDAIAWSHDLLTQDEQVVFRRLGVFAGGAPLDAVDTVCASGTVSDPIATVESLVGQSLVQAAEAPPGHPRVAMLETIREYALRQLRASGDDAPARQAHATYYAELAQRHDISICLTDQAASLDRLKVDHANLRAALRWLWEQGPAAAIPYCRLCANAFIFWWARGHIQEGLDWVDRALTLSVPPADRASILRAASYVRLARGELGPAETLAREAVETAGAAGLHSVHAYGLYALGWVAEIRGDIDAAMRTYEAGLAVAGQEPAPLPFQVGLLKDALAVSALRGGDLDRAETYAREALAVLVPLGERFVSGLASSTLGWVRYHQGDVAGALVAWDEAFQVAREMDDPQQMGVGLAAFGRAALDTGQTTLAARWLGAADTLRERAGRQRMEIYHQFEQSAALARDRLTPEQFDRAWRAGGGLALDEVWAEIERAKVGRKLSAPLTAPVALTPREAEILPLLAAGRSNPDIAEVLYLSVRTVERHVASLFTALGVHSRADAVEVARAAGLLPSDADPATGTAP